MLESCNDEDACIHGVCCGSTLKIENSGVEEKSSPSENVALFDQVEIKQQFERLSIYRDEPAPEVAVV